MKQQESGSKRTTNLSKCQSKTTEQTRKKYFDYLIDPSFQGVNILFVLSFENKTDTQVHKRYFLLKVEIRYYNVIIDGINFIWQHLKDCNWSRRCLLDYIYFKEH